MDVKKRGKDINLEVPIGESCALVLCSRQRKITRTSNMVVPADDFKDPQAAFPETPQSNQKMDVCLGYHPNSSQ